MLTLIIYNNSKKAEAGINENPADLSQGQPEKP
jgi:hypothetical protein